MVPFAGALLFAFYALLTRQVGRFDSAETSLFYTGVAGAVAITLVGPFFWTPIHGGFDWFWMLTLCAFGVLGHFLMIKAYEVAEASAIQPFAYFQLVFVSFMGYALFGERPDGWTIAGGALILAAGIYTLIRRPGSPGWRDRQSWEEPSGGLVDFFLNLCYSETFPKNTITVGQSTCTEECIMAGLDIGIGIAGRPH